MQKYKWNIFARRVLPCLLALLMLFGAAMPVAFAEEGGVGAHNPGSPGGSKPNTTDVAWSTLPDQTFLRFTLVEFPNGVHADLTDEAKWNVVGTPLNVVWEKGKYSSWSGDYCRKNITWYDSSAMMYNAKGSDAPSLMGSSVVAYDASKGHNARKVMTAAEFQTATGITDTQKEQMFFCNSDNWTSGWVGGDYTSMWGTDPHPIGESGIYQVYKANDAFKYLLTRLSENENGVGWTKEEAISRWTEYTYDLSGNPRTKYRIIVETGGIFLDPDGVRRAMTLREMMAYTLYNNEPNERYNLIWDQSTTIKNMAQWMRQAVEPQFVEYPLDENGIPTGEEYHSVNGFMECDSFVDGITTPRTVRDKIFSERRSFGLHIFSPFNFESEKSLVALDVTKAATGNLPSGQEWVFALTYITGAPERYSASKAVTETANGLQFSLKNGETIHINFEADESFRYTVTESDTAYLTDIAVARGGNASVSSGKFTSTGGNAAVTFTNHRASTPTPTPTPTPAPTPTPTPAPVYTDALVYKRDAVTNRGVGPATFRFTSKATGEVYDFTTDASGNLEEIQWWDPDLNASGKYIKPGQYTVTELVPPATHLPTTQEESITLSLDSEGNPIPAGPLVFTNLPKCQLRVVKYSRTGHTLMSGVTFEVFRNTVSLGRYETRNGEILLTNLLPGTYRVVEVDTGDGEHIVDDWAQEVELKPDGTVKTLTFFNDILPGLNITKVDAADPGRVIQGTVFEITGQDNGYGPQRFTTDRYGKIDLSHLPAGTYLIQEKACPGYVVDNTVHIVTLAPNENAELIYPNDKLPSLILTKQTANGKPMVGVTFSLAPMGDGAHSDERTTNAQGVITWEGLEPGLYSLVEVATKSTHVLDATEHHVRLLPGQNATLTLVNKEKPSLRIVKYDRQSGQPMEGVTFEVFRDTVSLGKYQTNSDGEILLSHIDPGTYKAIEVDVGNDTHILTTTPQEVELKAGDGTRELAFFNDRLPGIHLVKVDSADLSTPIPNAKFRFETVDGSYGPVEFSTGKDGTIDLSKLPTGAYVVTELECPGYVVDNAQRIIDLKPNSTAQFVFTNTALPGLVLTKLSSDGTPMEGVTFRIAYAEDCTHYRDYTTGPDGTITLSDMEPGLLSIRELSTLPDYIADTQEWHIKLVAGETATLTLTNQLKPSLKITKFDRQSHQPMGGVTFEVFRDTTSLGKFQTNAEGEVLLSYVEPGTYRVAEVDTGDDAHILDTTPQEVELRAGDDVRELVFFDDLLPGVHLTKVDSADLTKPIANAKFRFESVKGDFGPVEYTTMADGTIDLSKLPVGSFIVIEVECPGYVVDNGQRIIHLDGNENAEFVFTNSVLPSLHLTKTGADGKPLEGATFRIAAVEDGSHVYDRTTDKNGEITITDLEPGVYSVTETIAPKNYALDGKEHHVELLPGKVSEIILTNTLKPSLRIVKYDRQSHKAMEGVTFEVFRDTTSLGKFQTNNQGEILLSYVEPGTYKAAEVDVGNDTHILTTTPQEVELKAGDGTRELVFFNDKLPGLHLIKVDSADLSTPIPNAKFRFESVKGDYGPVEFSTEKDGTIDLSKLPTGAYVVTELECPGYVVDDAQRIIHLDGNETAQFVFTNTKLPSFKLTKTGADGKPLEGVTFRIAYVEDGTHYLDKTTDVNGQIVLDGLEPGVLSIVETATLPNYILDPTEHHVELTEGKTATIDLKNDRRPNLTIHKRDADTDEPVPGTVFQVKVPDGHSVAEVTTGQDGSVTVPNLLPGVYEVEEKFVPAPYLLDAEAQTVTLYANHDREVTFKNHKKPTLTVNKVDSVTGDPIQGAKFGVAYASNSTSTGEVNDLGTFYSDANGRFYIDSLRDGWYKVTELESAKGYAIQEPATQEVYIKGGESKVLTFKNVPLSALVVWKYDSVTGAAVEGAVFSVKYLGGTSGSGGTVIGTYKTSANGSFTITGLQAGTYVVEELVSDSAHVIDTAPQTAYISGKAQDVAQLYFGNSPKASLTVKKIDSVSHKPLSDVEFLVTFADGSLVGNANGKYITDSAGIFTISDLNPGTTLVVKETRAKDGYILDDAPQTITVKAGQAASLEFRNAPMGALVITKQDSQTKKPLSGATFRITTSSGQFVAAQGGAVSSNGFYTTDRNGQIVLTGLEPDTYVVTETKAPSGYELDSTPQTVAVNAHDTQSLFFYNTAIPEGGLRIVKLDEATRQPIGGVEFSVTHMDGKRVGTYRTNSKGIISLADLNPGWYTVTETKAAEGYALDEQPRDIEVKDGETAVLEVTNRLTGSALIHKVDAVTGKGIYGVTFLVSDAKGYPVGQYTTDQDGYIYIQGELADGKYTIREIQQAEGYLPDTTVKTFWVEYGACSTITWKNTPVSGQIQITKTSADYNSVNGWPAGTSIPGTEFEVYNRAGALVDTIRTDKNGVAVTKALPLGRYTLVESKAADNYLLDKTPIAAEIEFAGQIVRTAMTNKSVTTGVSVTKTGYAEVMPGQTIRYTLKDIANTSSVPINNFYWRDSLPNAVRLSKVVTGTWNAQGSYKLVYRTNLSGSDYRTLADNLSTQKNYTLDASPTALRLAANEYVTEVMAVFGVVPAGFRQVEQTKIDCTVVSWLTGDTQFANQADVGGTYNGTWVQATSRWVTKVYAPAKPLPRTGY